MPERVIAIGDIHGCADAFAAILKLIEPTQDDTLVVLGDCIDRGPGSRRVIELMLDADDRCNLVPLFGNHEEMLLAAVDRPGTAISWLSCGGTDTLVSYGVASAQELPREHLLYIRTWKDYYEIDTHFFAHGSYNARVPLDRQEWGYERWQSLRDRMPKAHRNGKTAVVGHTSQKDGEVLDADYLLCIDTYCCGGKWLTAVDVSNGLLWQVDAQGQPRDGRETPVPVPNRENPSK